MSLDVGDLLGYAFMIVLFGVLLPFSVLLTYSLILKLSPRKVLSDITRSPKNTSAIIVAPYEFLSVAEARQVFSDPKNKTVFVDGKNISSLDRLLYSFQVSLNKATMDLDWVGLETMLNDCSLTGGQDMVIMHEFLPNINDNDLQTYFVTIFWYWRHYTFFHHQHGCKYAKRRFRIVFVVFNEEHEKSLREMFIPLGKYFGTVVDGSTS